MKEVEVKPRSRSAAALLLFAAVLAACGSSNGERPAQAPQRSLGDPVAAVTGRADGSSREPRRLNVYAHTGARMLAPAVRNDRRLVYVPNSRSNTVDVIDQGSFRIVARFPVPAEPQHVVPAWNLRRLWVASDVGNALVPIDPRTGRHGRPVPVCDPYNLYFTPNGRYALVVAERLQRLDFRDPRTMALRKALGVRCPGVDHVDFTADGRRGLASCEFSGRMVAFDAVRPRVLGYLTLRPGAMPQDVRLSPGGSRFFVADMASDGVWVIDARRLRKIGFVRTGRGAHGIYPSRDARVLYVSNRDEGSISVLAAATGRPLKKWWLPGGGSPDMGGLSVDGHLLWLSGRYHGVVYVIDTRSGRLVHRIRVGSGPHGLCVWPQPGRFSLGHTGNMR